MAEKEKKKNSFSGIIFIIFAVLVCFALTIYGIVYLTGKIFSGEEAMEVAKIKVPAVSTDPEKGDILMFSSEPEKTADEIHGDFSPAVPKEESAPTPIVTQQYAVDKPVEVAPATPVAKKEEKPVAKEQPAQKKEAAPKQEAAKAVKQTKSGEYVVQIMAVKNEKEAEKEADKYRSVCSDVFVQKADLGSKGVWYRLRCGVTSSKDEAVATRDMLKSKFKGITPQVVSNK